MIAGVGHRDDRGVDQDHEEAATQREERRPRAHLRGRRGRGPCGGVAHGIRVNTRPLPTIPGVEAGGMSHVDLMAGPRPRTCPRTLPPPSFDCGGAPA